MNCSLFITAGLEYDISQTYMNILSEGMKIPQERKFQGTKVLGTFAHEERKFHRSDSSKEQMLHGTKIPREQRFHPWRTFRSQERQCRGTKSPSFISSICVLNLSQLSVSTT